MKHIKKQIALLIATIILLGSGTILIYHYRSNAPQISHAAPITVTLTPITYHISEQTVKAYGTTVSPTSIVIRAQDNAEIAGIYFKPGQLVTKGQLLFRLKISDIGSQQQKLKAQMQQSKSFYMRLFHINQKNPEIVASFDLLKAKSQYQQDLASYRQLIELENIRAPLNGMISDTNYSVGDIISSGGELAQITDPTSLEVKYQLPSQYAKKTCVGQTVRFYPDDTTHVYIGKISYVSPQFDSNNYSLTIRANLDDFTGLRPNHFGQIVQVINPRYKTLAVPQGLVHNDAHGFYIYTVENNKVDKRYFTAGTVSKDGLVQILSGIKANTMVINSDQSVINEGQTVQVNN